MIQSDDTQIRALLAHVDHPAPAVSAADLIGAARRRRATGRAKLAATFILCVVAAGAAWAAPASPLRDWAHAIAARIAPRPTPPQGPGQASAAPAGIAVPPGQRFVIVFVSAGAGVVHVSLTDQADVAVEAPPGTATFNAEASRLVVSSTAGATFALRLPRGAPHIEVRSGDRLLLLKEGARLTTADGATLALPLSLDLAPGGP